MGLAERIVNRFLPQNFRSLGIKASGEFEQVLFNGRNIADSCGLFCLKPLVFVVWDLDGSQRKLLESGQQSFRIMTGSGKRLLCELKIKKTDELSHSGIVFHFLQIVDSKIHYSNKLRNYIFLKSTQLFRNSGRYKFSFSELQQLSAVYTIPRKVFLTAISDGSKYYLFPMDFHGKSVNSKSYFIGLQQSNAAGEILNKDTFWAVFDVSYGNKDRLISLSREISGNFKDIDEFESKIISDFKPYSAWRIEFADMKKLGSHNFCYGNIIDERQFPGPEEMEGLFYINALYERTTADSPVLS